MGMIYFDCPFCSYGKTVPQKYQGKKIKCPRCLATLTLGVPQPNDLTALPLPEGEDDQSPVDQTAIEIETSELQLECPFCFKLVDPELSYCPHCNKSLKQECHFCFELIDASDIQCPKCHRELKERMVREETPVTPIFQPVLAFPNSQKIFYVGMAALVCGLGIILGPIAIWLAIKNASEKMTTAETNMVNEGMVMAAVGTIASFMLLIRILLFG